MSKGIPVEKLFNHGHQFTIPKKGHMNTVMIENHRTNKMLVCGSATSWLGLNENAEGSHGRPTSQADFWFLFGNFFRNPWSEKHGIQQVLGSSTSKDGDGIDEISLNPPAPEDSMVGISMVAWGHMSRASLKKTMEDLTEELEQASQKSTKLNEDKDPHRLFTSTTSP
ncbi:uncharacterized protein LOC120111603 [Phoenix dactylifera]|uniref:Uncharacterized protein LOC120111603 n=1 Tax=Phoenix dactylifera TaxID=42345 RepID=A0A8B9AE98_PHODC|nr:uncharacterized protein LOC120111603 [Phoenix dactylifera]